MREAVTLKRPTPYEVSAVAGKVLQEDIIKDIKRHAFYLKPGQKKRVKAAEARKRARKNKKRSWDSDSDQHRS